MDNPEETTPRTINDFRESLGLPRVDDPWAERVYDFAWTPAKLENGWTGAVGATVTDGEVELHGHVETAAPAERRRLRCEECGYVSRSWRVGAGDLLNFQHAGLDFSHHSSDCQGVSVEDTLTAADVEHEANDTYLNLGIITAEEHETERIKIGERHPAQPGDDDYVEPVERGTGFEAIPERAGTMTLMDPAGFDRDPVQTAAHNLGQAAFDNGWTGSLTIEVDGDDVVISGSMRGPKPSRSDVTPVVWDFAPPAPLYEVGTKVIFRSVAGEEVVGEIAAVYPDDPMTYRVFADDGASYSFGTDAVITPFFTGRAAMMHFDDDGGLAETIDVPAEDMRLVDEQWVMVVRNDDGSEVFLPPDVLELPGEEFEAI